MHALSTPIISLDPRRSVTREDLLALAGFFDAQHRAISFYLSLSPSPNNSHREELLMIKDLVKLKAGQIGVKDSVAQDLDAIVQVAEEIRHKPSQLWAVFACRDQHVWQVFELPASTPIAHLEIGRHFHLAPLLQAVQASASYCVVMVEHGKARMFSARGTEIQEIIGLQITEASGPRPNDSRVGWSHHVDGNEQERDRASLKRIATALHHFMEKHKYSRLVIGCRDDLWSEFEPQLHGTEKAALIGRFHTANFDVSPADVLQATRPIFQKSLHIAYEDLLRKINEGSSRSSVGLNQVLENLEEGRVQKILMGKQSEEKVSECLKCGHLHAGLQGKCVFCGSSNTHAVLAQEALIRKALLTEAEILLPSPGDAGADRVAAWLRY